LAQEYCDKAIEAISAFPDSEAKRGLVEMCTKVMQKEVMHVSCLKGGKDVMDMHDVRVSI